MSEQPVKKRKMNALGIICVVISFAIMEYSQFNSTDSTLFWKFASGVLTYGSCFLGAGVVTILLWIGMYMANLFFNTIYDENKEPPSLKDADLLIFVFFAFFYIGILAGWIKV